MLWILLLVVFAVIVIGLVLTGLISKETRIWWFMGAGSAVGLFLLITVLLSVKTVGSGHEGVVYNYAGVVSGQIHPGMQLVLPVNSVDVVTTQTQYARFDNLTAVSKENQDVFGTVQVNYHLDPRDVTKLYKDVGPNWYETFVPAAVNQNFKELTAGYNTVDIVQHRQEIAQNLTQRLKAILEEHSIYVEDAFISNISYSKAFNDAIEAKQVASQQVQQAKLEADTLRAQAQGKADAAVTEARGNATANELLNKSLTDQLIRYQQVQKLNPNVQVIVVPNDGTLISLGDITQLGKK